MKVSSVKKELVHQATVYNISLEGDDQFFANSILNHNTPPHIIRPKNKKALRWSPHKGKKAPHKDDIFAKVVHHPGTSPQPFIRNTLRTKLKGIIKNNMKMAMNEATP